MKKPGRLKKEKFQKRHFRVAIFGSARITKSDAVYTEVYELANMIAKEGMDVVTGGGPGLMEAANSGHREGRNNNNHVLSYGLNIKLPFEQNENKHLDIKKEFNRFSGRLDTFMTLSNAVVVAPGGIGTLLEFFYAWQLVQVKHIDRIPIILMGRMWPGLFDWIREWPLENKLLSPADVNMLFLAKTPESAMEIILAAREGFRKSGGKKFCNLSKYPME